MDLEINMQHLVLQMLEYFGVRLHSSRLVTIASFQILRFYLTYLNSNFNFHNSIYFSIPYFLICSLLLIGRMRQTYGPLTIIFLLWVHNRHMA
jgi:membrane-bound acyltransferase YfiQ involved in biofilm formation